MFEFKIHKSPDSTDEEFKSAIFCAKNCIDSTLHDEGLNAKIAGQSLVIQAIDQEQEVEITATELKEKIKGCFCDSSGNPYPEFTQVSLPQ